jgi:uncharacterized protein YjgD (DUF1641 family)
MAPPIPLKQTTPQDVRELQEKRLKDASLDHADAILSAYEVLQTLHESGALELLRGAAGARDALLEQLASVLSTPEAIQALRNLIVIGKELGRIDPNSIKAAREEEPAAAKPPSLWQLVRRASSKDGRRGIAIAVGLLDALGRGSQK